MNQWYPVLILIGLFFASGLGCISHPPVRSKPPKIESSPQPSETFHLPLKNPTILSRYGPRGKKMHTGIDLRVTKGGRDPVYSSRAGRVTFSGRFSSYGNFVSIQHADGFTSRYAHLHKIFVKKGEQVRIQEPIGMVGRTGRASTNHLHFEILTPKFRFVDPYPYLFSNTAKK